MAKPRKPVPSKVWQQLFRGYTNRPFPQINDMSESQFVSYAGKCGIHTSAEDLAHFETRGLLSPLFRSTYDYRQGSPVTMIYLPGTREFNDLQQMKRVPDPSSHFSVTDHYHPYQLFMLHSLTLWLPRVSFGFWTQSEDRVRSRSCELRGWILKDVEDEARSWSTTRFPDLLRLLLWLEQKYRPFVVGTVSNLFLHWTGRQKHPPTIEEWYTFSDKFAAGAVAARYNVSLRDAKRWHSALANKADYLDPLSEWYYLVRHVPYRKREKLKGKALLAQQYYVTAEMIRLFANDAFGADLPRENEWHHERNWDEYEEKLYGRRVTFRNPKTLQYILNDYGINPQARMKVFVEGESEKLGIEMLAETSGVDLEEESIEIENLSGEGNFDANKLEHYLRDLRNRHVRYLFILDPHDRAVRGMKKLIEKSAKGGKSAGLLSEEQCVVWKKDFERDNFTHAQIVRSVNALLTGASRRRLTRKDLERPEYAKGIQSLENLVRQTVSPRSRLRKVALTRRLFADHVLGKRGIRPSYKSPIVEVFRKIVREAKTNFRPTMAEGSPRTS